jgi:hypothetical protein
MELDAKLQLKPGQGVEVFFAPTSVLSALAARTATVTEGTSAMLVFVADRATLEKQRTRIVRAVNEERLTWIAYPKAGQLGTDLNRDSLATLAPSERHRASAPGCR